MLPTQAGARRNAAMFGSSGNRRERLLLFFMASRMPSGFRQSVDQRRSSLG
jgi:hypothetical protein